MFDRFRRAQNVPPPAIHSTVWNALRPEEKAKVSYARADARIFLPADRHTFRLDPQSYGSTFDITSVGSLRVSGVFNRRGTVCVTEPPGHPAYCLYLVKRGSVVVQSPRDQEPWSARENELLVYEGVAGTRVTTSDKAEQLCVWIPAARLRTCLEALVDRTVSGSLVFSSKFATMQGGGASIRHLLSFVETELSQANSLITGSVSAGLFEDLLCRTVVHRLEHNYSDLLDGPRSAGLGSVRRTEEYIRGHLTEPVTLVDLARAAGCSGRSLQLAFQQVRGITPMTALRNARLEQARRTLERGENRMSVTDVALQFGFSNPGRFAHFYRAAFGERPLKTLHTHH